MHKSQLLEVIADINPKVVIRVARDHIVHELELAVQIILYVFGSVGLAFEIESDEIFVSGVDICIGGIALEEASSAMLLERRNVRIGVDVNFIPSDLSIGVLMADVPKFVRLDFCAHFEIGVQGIDF